MFLKADQYNKETSKINFSKQLTQVLLVCRKDLQNTNLSAPLHHPRRKKGSVK